MKTKKISNTNTNTLQHDILNVQYQEVQNMAKKIGIHTSNYQKSIYKVIQYVLDNSEDVRLFDISRKMDSFETLPQLQYRLQYKEPLNECYLILCVYLYVKYEFITLAFKLYNIKFKNDLKIDRWESFQLGDNLKEDTLNSIYAKVYTTFCSSCQGVHMDLPYDEEGATEISELIQAFTKASVLTGFAFNEPLSENLKKDLYDICKKHQENN